MRQANAAILVLGVLFATGYGTFAWSRPAAFPDNLSTQYPGTPGPLSERHSSRYPMTYIDEAAQNLGVRDGHMDFFSTEPDSSYLPSFSAGVDKGGAMFRLRWHPGD